MSDWILIGGALAPIVLAFVCALVVLLSTGKPQSAALGEATKEKT